MRHLRVWRWIVGLGLVAVLAAAGILVAYRIPLSSDRLRREVIATLSERLQSDVELASLELHPFPRMRVSGTGLTIRHRRQPDVPLIKVRSFTVTANLRALLSKHVAHVTLDGLEITIASREDEGTENGQAPPDARRRRPRSELVIDQLVADDARVTVLPREVGKRPKVWALHELRLESVGLLTAMPFTSRLTNAVPPGTIDTSGQFGPWDAADPGQTPVTGTFTFDQATLGVFKGISGTLSSTGRYDGTLERLTARGHTSTPDFTLDVSGHSVALETNYEAVVDATNGNTTLERIEATFLNSRLVAHGSVIDQEGPEGRLVSLDVDMPNARLEDVLWLAVKTPKPTMTGALGLKTRFVLPPGKVDVVDKLRLDGTFTIEGGRFTDKGVQEKINSLSGKARGRGDAKAPRVTSTFTGRFALGDGRLALTPLEFDVPGAIVNVQGHYGLRRETLSFAGAVMLDAKLSQTVSGWKSLLLKPIDPLFRRKGRTFVPITIRGTRNDPRFGLDIKRVFNRNAPPVPPKAESN